ISRNSLTAPGHSASSRAARADPVCSPWRSISARKVSAAASSSCSATTSCPLSRRSSTPVGSCTNASPPVMPAPMFRPNGPRMTTVPFVMYSHALLPTPSTTAVAPELRTAKRSPAEPARKSSPPGAPFLRADVTERFTMQGREQAVQLQRPGPSVGVTPLQKIRAADRFVEAPQSNRRELTAHLLANEQEVVLDHLGRRRELRAQLRTLCRDPDRAAVDVTRAHHQAALGEEQSGAEADLVGSEECRDDHIAAGLDPAVHAQA